MGPYGSQLRYSFSYFGPYRGHPCFAGSHARFSSSSKLPKSFAQYSRLVSGLSPTPYMSCCQTSKVLNGRLYRGIYRGSIIRVIRGDARSLDHTVDTKNPA